MRSWFRNTAKRGGLHPSDSGVGTRREAPSEIPASVTLQVARELKKVIKGRATSATAWWARDNEAAVTSLMVGAGIGDRQRAVKQCFDALPLEEQNEWREVAKRHVASSEEDPNQCFE